MQKVQLENHWASYQKLKILYLEKWEILLVTPSLQKSLLQEFIWKSLVWNRFSSDEC